MNYYQHNRPSPFGNLKQFFSSGSTLSILIIINAGIWLLISTMGVIAYLFRVPEAAYQSFIVDYFALPADLPQIFVHPWTLITYMFLHINFFHILFNLLWLYWFGLIFRQYLSSRQLLSVYFWGGLAGGILYVVTYNIFPVFADDLSMARALGASASVMAIVTAISFFVPNYSIQLLFIGRVKLLYLAIVLFVVDFFMIRSSNSGGHIAHIGGFLYGFLWVFLTKRNIFSGWPLKMSFRNPFRRKSGFKARTYQTERPVSDDDYNTARKKQQERIDEILEKISKFGYERLTKEEKDLLFRSGNKNS
ncbi:MAG: rhomboid family intramembrane serine protease [Bacteroidetes bacterium]|nr:rhomboid family intramembrane serine protease [Bacteroidota bacterium]